jgi:molybdopterin converting factor subunit 1
MTAMTIEVQLFARLREACDNQPHIDLELADAATTAAAFDALSDRYAAARPFREGLAVAVNDEYASWDTVLEEGDRLSFIPPVSGG